MIPQGFIKVYVDMDGVLTDFDKAVRAIGGERGLPDDASKEDTDQMFKRIDEAGPEFWSGMDWMPGAKKLWEKIRLFNPVLLSSPGDLRYAKRGKQDWVNKNIPGVTLYLDKDKYQWAERDAVLIDDSAKNIGAWRQAGGIGILHENPEKTEIELLSLLSPRDE